MWTSPWRTWPSEALQTAIRQYGLLASPQHPGLQEPVAWTLERFLGLRPYLVRHKYRNAVLQSSVQIGTHFFLTQDQLEAVLVFIHKSLSRRQSDSADSDLFLGDSMEAGKIINAIVIALTAPERSLFERKPSIVLANRNLLDQWLATFH